MYHKFESLAVEKSDLETLEMQVNIQKLKIEKLRIEISELENEYGLIKKKLKKKIKTLNDKINSTHNILDEIEVLEQRTLSNDDIQVEDLLQSDVEDGELKD